MAFNHSGLVSAVTLRVGSQPVSSPAGFWGFWMQLRLRVLAVLSTSILLAFGLAQAQTPGTGAVTISGSEQGPIYPCGNTSCPTYDSGQITITVNGFNAVTNYSHTGGQKTSQQLANALAAKLNATTSPVTAVVANAKITLTSKLAGTLSNYPLSTLVTHSSLFAHASFAAAPSGPSLTGSSGRPAPVGPVVRQESNDTSLCSSSSDPGGNLSYCSAFFNGFNTNFNNPSAETPVPDSPAGHVSNISLKQLMYLGWTGRVICEYQPMFGLSSHKTVG